MQRSDHSGCGVTHSWRFDRMATVCHLESGRVTASFAGVAKHYGVSVSICPPRSGHRKGVVEKINHGAAQRWWRTLGDDLTVEQAQAGIDTFAATRGDTRVRAGHLDGAGRKVNVATVAAGELLRPAPTSAYPVIISDARTVTRQALVAYRGNRYSMPPELAGTQVAVTRPLGAEVIDIATSSGIVIARTGCSATAPAPSCATAGTSSPSRPLPWRPPPAATPGGRTAARNASHPARPRSLQRPRCVQRHRGRMP